MDAIVCEQSDVTKAVAVVAAAHGMATLLLTVVLVLLAFYRVIPKRLAKEAWPSTFQAYGSAGDKLQSQTSVSLRPLIRNEEDNPETFVLEGVDGPSPQTSCPGSATMSTVVVPFSRDVPPPAAGDGLERCEKEKEVSSS